MVNLRVRPPWRIVELDDGRELSARSVIIATGADYRRLGVANVERFEGMGVFYNAGADIATALRGQDVVVCGGGNSAGQAVVHLAKAARRVVHVVRGNALGQAMSAYLVREISQLPNVEVRLDTEIVDGSGTLGLSGITVRHRSGATEVISTRALFVMIGARPHTDWLAGVVERDRNGFILTGTDLGLRAREHFSARQPLRLETSMPGVFAAGDVRAGSIKRLASAVGEGTIAVQLIHDYLQYAEERAAA